MPERAKLPIFFIYYRFMTYRSMVASDFAKIFAVFLERAREIRPQTLIRSTVPEHGRDLELCCSYNMTVSCYNYNIRIVNYLCNCAFAP